MGAWGLFESKHGELNRAKRLLKRAVSLDESLSAVLRWKLFRDPPQPRRVEPRPYASGTGMTRALRTRGVYALQPGEVEERLPTSGNGRPMEKAMLHLAPSIRYAVPSLVPGWRGRPEHGEDPSRWYDADGVRNGPPRNYWRQSLDERLYRDDMSLLEAILHGEGDEVNNLMAELQMRGKKIRQPSLNRKLLGRWA